MVADLQAVRMEFKTLKESCQLCLPRLCRKVVNHHRRRLCAAVLCCRLIMGTHECQPNSVLGLLAGHLCGMQNAACSCASCLAACRRHGSRAARPVQSARDVHARTCWAASNSAAATAVAWRSATSLAARAYTCKRRLSTATSVDSKTSWTITTQRLAASGRQGCGRLTCT